MNKIVVMTDLDNPNNSLFVHVSQNKDRDRKTAIRS